MFRPLIAETIDIWNALLCSGPEITDELVKVLRKRLDETTLDIITVMLVRNCKLTPADVEVNHSFFFSKSLLFCCCLWMHRSSVDTSRMRSVLIPSRQPESTVSLDESLHRCCERPYTGHHFVGGVMCSLKASVKLNH